MERTAVLFKVNACSTVAQPAGLVDRIHPISETRQCSWVENKQPLCRSCRDWRIGRGSWFFIRKMKVNIAPKKRGTGCYNSNDAYDCLKLPEFKACYRMLRNWKPYIQNSFDISFSNGFIEGCNNATKVLKRVCFGMPRFDHLRTRILLASSFDPNI